MVMMVVMTIRIPTAHKHGGDYDDDDGDADGGRMEKIILMVSVRLQIKTDEKKVPTQNRGCSLEGRG